MKKKKVSNKNKVIKDIKKDISISIKILGRFYTSKGKTLEEAISKLKIPIARGIGILVVQKGNIKKERILNGRIINGLFGQNPTMRSLALKNLNMLF